MPGRVLIVEDEVDLAATMEYSLTREGYQVSVAHTGAAALAAALAEPGPDVIVLDLMLPDLPGTEVCRRLREHDRTRDLPIVMCTAKDTEIDRVVGFEVGADDYVVKPFLLEELVARVVALLRRAGRVAGGAVQVDDLVVDEGAGMALRGGRPIDLTATEFRLLVQLARGRGRVISKTQLLTQVWGYDQFDPNLVEVHVSSLRRKTEADGMDRLIHTVRGMGYALRAPVP